MYGKYNPYLVSIDQCLLPRTRDNSHFASLEKNNALTRRVECQCVGVQFDGLVIILTVQRSVAQILQLLNTAYSKIWGESSISLGYVADGTPYRVPTGLAYRGYSCSPVARSAFVENTLPPP